MAPPQGEPDSEIGKPTHFDGTKPESIRAFIAQCIMAFDNKPRKFSTDRQRVAYAASYLSGIALDWWLPHLTAVLEPTIRTNWDEFILALNQSFGQPDLAQSAQRSIRQLKMKDNHRVNKYMIRFAEHAPHTGWNDPALYDAFYDGLAERLKDHLLSLPRATTLDTLKQQALECDNRYWARQNEKTSQASSTRQTSNTSTNTKDSDRKPFERKANNAPSDKSKPSRSAPADRKDLSSVLDSTGHLTDAEKERRKAKGLCIYCGEKPDHHSRECIYKKNPQQASGRATFTISAEPQSATIEEVTDAEEPQSSAEN